MFKDTESYGLVSVQFLSALNLFFGGDVQISKDTITALYKNISLETLISERQVEFEKMSGLIAHINFKIKHYIFANIGDQNDRSNKN